MYYITFQKIVDIKYFGDIYVPYINYMISKRTILLKIECILLYIRIYYFSSNMYEEDFVQCNGIYDTCGAFNSRNLSVHQNRPVQIFIWPCTSAAVVYLKNCTQFIVILLHKYEKITCAIWSIASTCHWQITHYTLRLKVNVFIDNVSNKSYANIWTHHVGTEQFTWSCYLACSIFIRCYWDINWESHFV